MNWPRTAHSFEPIDLGLEHLNRSCQNEIKCYKNSTCDVDIIFDRVCLCNAFVRDVRILPERVFGTHLPSDHTTASAQMDMFLLARTLLSNDLAEPRNQDQLYGAFFDSEDIIVVGMEVTSGTSR